MVAAPIILGEALKISDQNNWGGPEQKIKFVGELNFSGGPMNIVGKGGHTTPFLDQAPLFQIPPPPPFYKSKMSPPFIGL